MKQILNDESIVRRYSVWGFVWCSEMFDNNKEKNIQDKKAALEFAAGGRWFQLWNHLDCTLAVTLQKYSTRGEQARGQEDCPAYVQVSQVLSHWTRKIVWETWLWLWKHFPPAAATKLEARYCLNIAFNIKMSLNHNYS